MCPHILFGWERKATSLQPKKKLLSQSFYVVTTYESCDDQTTDVSVYMLGIYKRYLLVVDFDYLEIRTRLGHGK